MNNAASTITDNTDHNSNVSAWAAVTLCGMAGGMGWGIRGQYGHESGAMMAGLLVSSVIAMLFLRDRDGWEAVRAIAWCTVAIGFGGSETYGQTIGLTQNAHLIGNMSALLWGMLGLAIKGGLWIGFAGCFLGMALGGGDYRRRDMIAIVLCLPLLYLLGIRLFNSPFDPSSRQLPAIYFSETWFWKTTGEVKPRFECWGGLLLAMAGLMTYCRRVRRDKLAWRLGLAGLIGGAIGFPGGQCLQANHAWNPDLYQSGLIANLDQFMNWWNMMEITFGTIMGAALGLAVWLNRHLINVRSSTFASQSTILDVVTVLAHVILLAFSEFAGVRWIDELYAVGFCMGAIPLAASVTSRWWPFLIAMPIVVLPIAGKTVRVLVFEESAISAVPGWLLYFVLPMVVAGAVCGLVRRLCDQGADGRRCGSIILLAGAWIFFLLNFAFFRFPWPWQPWTGRTPSGMIYAVCIITLTAAAAWFLPRSSSSEIGEPHVADV